jgi:hypothetical protein
MLSLNITKVLRLIIKKLFETLFPGLIHESASDTSIDKEEPSDITRIEGLKQSVNANLTHKVTKIMV